MKITVTGAAGFIGSHIAQTLSAANHEVVGIDNFNDHYSADLKRLNAKEIKEEGADIVEKDLADDAPIPDDTDILIHCAAQPGISSDVSFNAYERNNIQATQKLLRACENQDDSPFFINISTSSVYGLEATGAEDAEIKPASDYGVTKLGAEQLVMAYHRQEEINATSLRLFSVYGPRERPEKLFTKLIHAGVTDRAFPLYEGSRDHIRAFTYVGDVVKAVQRVLKKQSACDGEIINIGNDQTNTTGEAITAVENALGKKIEMNMQPARAGDQSKTSANIEKARDLLHYNPSTSLDKGVEEQVEWFRENNIHQLL